VTPIPLDVIHRVSPKFSATGRYATSIVADAHGRFAVESWVLTSAGPRWRFQAPVAEPIWTTGYPLENGRTVLVEHGSQTHSLTVLDAHGSRSQCPIEVASCQLLPPPPGSSALALGLQHSEAGSRILLVQPDGPVEIAMLERVRPVTGWPTSNGGIIFAAQDGRGYLLDLGTGRVEPLAAEMTPPGTLLVAVSGDRLLLTERADAGWRLLLGSFTTSPQELALPALTGRATPVAIHPQADEAALILDRGAASQLILVNAESSRLIKHGNATMMAPAAWTTDGLWGVGSTPHRPPTHFWLPPDAPSPQWSAPTEDGPPVRLEPVPGAAGELEAVVYGPDWADADHIIIALHGGPRDHWRAGYDRTLRLLAAEGLCILALNQRGSSGYGSTTELAIKGCWGGPDLADILAVAAWLRQLGCSEIGLLGTSYGAFLALLAAAAEPDGWTCCTAISPFISADRLYATAGPGVRALLNRLDALRPVRDELGSRDLVRLAPRIRSPTLIAHGRLDQLIPVEHSRAIAAAMAETGNPMQYLEIPDRGHAVLRSHPEDVVLSTALTLFQSSPRPGLSLTRRTEGVSTTKVLLGAAADHLPDGVPLCSASRGGDSHRNKPGVASATARSVRGRSWPV
jgi:pimeloyl-ACP methyl ester carboxylesterase